MKKTLCKKTLAIGIAALILAAPAADAATPMGVSNPRGVDPYMTDANQNKKTKKHKKKDNKVAVQQEQENVNQVEPPATDNNVEQSGPRDERLIPYIGKKITKQVINGNKLVPEAAVMSVLKTKPGTEFTEDGLYADLEAIYQMGWFYDLRPEFNIVPEGVQVTYHVMENPIYSGLKLEGITVLDKVKAEGFFEELSKGEIANLTEINRCVQKLQEEYRSAGYIFARVANVHMEQDGTLNVKVNEGTVESFKVTSKNNKKLKCKERVITREMRLKIGKPFNVKDAKRSVQCLENLGYFESVDFKINPGKEPDAKEIEIVVEERNTGSFGIGAGYSSTDGFLGMISIGDKNFRGTGDSVSIKWEFGGKDNKNYDFTYSKPWIDHKETRMTIELYDITRETADYNEDSDEIARYDKKRVGQALTLSRKTSHSDYITNFVTLKNHKDSYKGMAEDYENDPEQYYEPRFDPDSSGQNKAGKWRDWYPKTADERRKENFGTTRSLTLGRIYDSRDSIYNPRAGKRSSYTLEWGGFGGDFKFLKFTGDWRYYYRAGKHNPTNTWAWQFTGGYAGGDMALSQRFALGGDNLRGYKDDQFRGNSMLKATVEYRFPIIKKIQGVLFNDNGYAWDKRHERKFDLSKIKSSVGLGLRIESPFGPIKLDYGRGKNGGRFHFNFGGQF